MSEREREGVPLKKEKDWDGLSGNDIILELSELWHREWEVGDVSISQLWTSGRTAEMDTIKVPATGKEAVVKQQQAQNESFLQALP